MSNRWYFIAALIVLAVGIAYLVFNWGAGMWPTVVIEIIAVVLILIGLKQP